MRSLFRRIRAVVFGGILSARNGKCNVKIREYGTTYYRIFKGSICGNGVLLLNPNVISGRESSKLRIDKGGKLIINGNVSIYSGFKIHIGKDATLIMNDNTFINENSLISIKKKCVIGGGCALSNNVTILDSDFHEINGDVTNKEVFIGNNILIGANSIILKGAIIQDNCVIGAGSLVNNNIERNSIAVGRPAKRIKECVKWI